MRNEEYGFFAKRTQLHKIFGVEFGIASVAESASPEKENGICNTLFDEICCVVAAFEVGSLSIENGNPFNVFEFIVFDKPMTAFFKYNIYENGYNEKN